MLKSDQVSIIQYANLAGEATFSIDVSPQEVLNAFTLERRMTERSFDEFDYFDFLALHIDGGYIGFKQHVGTSLPYSNVCIDSISIDEAKLFIKSLFPERNIKMMDLE